MLSSHQSTAERNKEDYNNPIEIKLDQDEGQESNNGEQLESAIDKSFIGPLSYKQR